MTRPLQGSGRTSRSGADARINSSKRIKIPSFGRYTDSSWAFPRLRWSWFSPPESQPRRSQFHPGPTTGHSFGSVSVVAIYYSSTLSLCSTVFWSLFFVTRSRHCVSFLFPYCTSFLSSTQARCSSTISLLEPGALRFSSTHQNANFLIIGSFCRRCACTERVGLQLCDDAARCTS